METPLIVVEYVLLSDLQAVATFVPLSLFASLAAQALLSMKLDLG